MKGHFWTSVGEEGKSFQPKAQFRFRVEIDGFSLQDNRTSPDPKPGDFAEDEQSDTKIVWYAKSIDKPKISISADDPMQSAQGFAAYKISYPKSPLFDDITMTLIDPSYPNATRKILRWFRRSGYNDLNFYEEFDDARSRREFYKSVGNVKIIQMDPSGEDIETWKLINAFPKEVDFGTLSYDSEELVEIKITWSYETFTCSMPAYGEEKEFTYFNRPFGPNRDGSPGRTDLNAGEDPLIDDDSGAP